jgi:hypothetical protein
MIKPRSQNKAIKVSEKRKAVKNKVYEIVRIQVTAKFKCFVDGCKM